MSNNIIFVCLSFVVESHVNVFRGIIKGLFTGHVQYMDFSAEPKQNLRHFSVSRTRV